MPYSRSTFARLTTVACSALGVLLVMSLAGTADSIRLVPGATVKSVGGQVNGQIVSETALEVRIKAAGGAEQAIPVDQIDSVAYDGLPPSFLLAESRINAGSLQEAAELYGKAAGEASGKAFIERAAQFGRADALTELALVDPSKAADATNALDAFVKAHGNSRQLARALTDLIRVHLSVNNTDKAEAALGMLQTRVPWAAGRAAVLNARIQARKGDHESALSALEALVNEAPKGSAQAREARLAKAESLTALRRFPEAEQAVLDVIAEAPPDDDAIQSEAHNTLGDCLSAAGRPKDALIAYLKTDVLFSSARDQHARALARVAALWRELKQDGRANEVQDRLRQLYPQSPYARAGSN